MRRTVFRVGWLYGLDSLRSRQVTDSHVHTNVHTSGAPSQKTPEAPPEGAVFLRP